MLSSIKPLMLCFEDLHAADEASLRLFHYLCRQIAARPILIVATVRTDEMAKEQYLSQILASLRRERLATELTLSPLSDTAVRTLIAHRFGNQPVAPEILDEIATRAEGNPFFAAEMAYTLIEEGWVDLIDGRWHRRRHGGVPVPGPILDLLNLRLQNLSDATRQVLPTIAVLGPHFDYTLLRRLALLPEATLLDVLDDCIATNFVEETADGYRFRHNLFREAIYRNLTRARRQQLHRTVATTLAAVPDRADADSERIGYHFALSDEPWQAIPYLETAARRAMAVFANPQAVALFEQSVELARTHVARVGQGNFVRLLEDLGDLRSRMGDVNLAASLYEEALDVLTKQEDRDGMVRLRAKVALEYVVQGNVQAASRLLQATIQAITDRWPQLGIARVYYTLAQLRWHNAQHREALEAAEQAVRAAEASDDTDQQARAYEALALACHSLGDWQRGADTAQRLRGFDSQRRLPTDSRRDAVLRRQWRPDLGLRRMCEAARHHRRRSNRGGEDRHRRQRRRIPGIRGIQPQLLTGHSTGRLLEIRRARLQRSPGRSLFPSPMKSGPGGGEAVTASE